jgi:hypothetical protein
MVTSSLDGAARAMAGHPATIQRKIAELAKFPGEEVRLRAWRAMRPE